MFISDWMAYGETDERSEEALPSADRPATGLRLGLTTAAAERGPSRRFARFRPNSRLNR